MQQYHTVNFANNRNVPVFTPRGVTTKDAPIAYDIDNSLRYGDMPPAMLAARFEETDMGPDEHMYDHYARELLVDMRPDPVATAADEPRGRVNSSAGKLQLQYYGHRGNVEPASHPEMFLGFMDADPRGYSTDPNMARLREQEDARMRFVNFTADASNQITGGGRSESQVMRDKQDGFRRTKDNLRVFSRHIDGRKEGLRKYWRYCSSAARQQVQKSDYANNNYAPGRHNAQWVLAHGVDSRDIEDAVDHDLLSAHSYDQHRRGNKTAQLGDVILVAKEGTHDGTMRDGVSHKSATTKTVARLVQDIVKQRDQMQTVMASGDTERMDGRFTQSAKKHMAASADLAAILSGVQHMSDFGGHDVGGLGAKTATFTGDPVAMKALSLQNHDITPQVLTKAYKSVSKRDQSGIILDAVRSGADAEYDDGDETVTGKGGLIGGDYRALMGDVLSDGVMRNAVDAITTVVNYKNLLPQDHDRVGTYVGDMQNTESDQTIFGATNSNITESFSRDSIADGSRTTLANNKKERLTGVVGCKSVSRRHAMRTTDVNEF